MINRMWKLVGTSIAQANNERLSMRTGLRFEFLE